MTEFIRAHWSQIEAVRGRVRLSAIAQAIIAMAPGNTEWSLDSVTRTIRKLENRNRPFARTAHEDALLREAGLEPSAPPRLLVTPAAPAAHQHAPDRGLALAPPIPATTDKAAPAANRRRPHSDRERYLHSD